MIYTGLDGERHKINIDRNAEFYMIEYLPNNTKFRRKTLKHKYSRNKTLKHIVLRRFPKINMRIEYFVTSYGMPVSYPVYEKSYT